MHVGLEKVWVLNERKQATARNQNIGIEANDTQKYLESVYPKDERP